MTDALPNISTAADNLINALRQTQQILAEIDLNLAQTKPHSWLWRQISPLYQPVFQQGQLILCTYQGSIDQPLLDHLQKVLALCDISNNFVLVVTDDLDFGSKAEIARSYSTSLTAIPHQTATFTSHNHVSHSTDFSMPSTMCMAPWARLEIEPDGTCRPCCAIMSPIKDKQDRAMTVYDHGIDEIYHSDFLKDLRSQLRAGLKPSVCEKCWHNESMGRKSIRQHTDWDLKKEALNIDWDAESTQNLRSWRLSLGNICNLKCRICGPKCSSKWAAEIYNNLPKEQKKSSKIYNQFKKTSWAELPDLPIWTDIQNTVDHITELRLTGGEPLLIHKQFEIMEFVSQTPRAKHIALVYNTNGTVPYPENFVRALAAFKEISISLSIDDIGSRFEYQRSGSVWKDVQQNVRSYATMKSRFPNFTLKMNCVVSILNVFYLPELIDWLDDQCFDFVSLDVMQLPTPLSINRITKNFQAACIQRLCSRDWPLSVKDQIQSIIQNLRKAELSDGREFCDYVRLVDQRRQENFAQHHGEVADLMGYRLQVSH